MKKGIFLLLAAILLLGTSSPVFAETATGTKSTGENSTTKEVTAPVKKGILSEERKAIIRQFGTNLIERLSAALTREQDLGMRIGSRIQKFEANGIDMTAVKTKLADTQNLWQKTVQNVSGLQQEIDKVVDSQSPKTAFTATKKIIKSATGDVKKVHAAIVDVIKILKAASPATTTAQTTTEASTTTSTESSNQ